MRTIFEVAWFMAFILLGAAWNSLDRKPSCRIRTPLFGLSIAFAGITGHAAIGYLGYTYPDRIVVVNYVEAGLLAAIGATILALFADGLTRITLLLCGGFVTYLWPLVLVAWTIV